MDLATQSKPEAATHRSTRTVTGEMGLSAVDVLQRRRRHIS